MKSSTVLSALVVLMALAFSQVESPINVRIASALYYRLQSPKPALDYVLFSVDDQTVNKFGCPPYARSQMNAVASELSKLPLVGLPLLVDGVFAWVRSPADLPSATFRTVERARVAGEAIDGDFAAQNGQQHTQHHVPSRLAALPRVPTYAEMLSRLVEDGGPGIADGAIRDRRWVLVRYDVASLIEGMVQPDEVRGRIGVLGIESARCRSAEDDREPRVSRMLRDAETLTRGAVYESDGLARFLWLMLVGLIALRVSLVTARRIRVGVAFVGGSVLVFLLALASGSVLPLFEQTLQIGLAVTFSFGEDARVFVRRLLTDSVRIQQLLYAWLELSEQQKDAAIDVRFTPLASSLMKLTQATGVGLWSRDVDDTKLSLRAKAGSFDEGELGDAAVQATRQLPSRSAMTKRLDEGATWWCLPFATGHNVGAMCIYFDTPPNNESWLGRTLASYLFYVAQMVEAQDPKQAVKETYLQSVSSTTRNLIERISFASERLSLLLESVDDAVFLFSATGRLTLSNGAAKGWLTYRKIDESIELFELLEEVFESSDLPRTLLMRCLAGDQVTCPVSTSWGSTLEVFIRGFFVGDSNEEIDPTTNIVVRLTDRSDRELNLRVGTDMGRFYATQLMNHLSAATVRLEILSRLHDDQPSSAKMLEQATESVFGAADVLRDFATQAQRTTEVVGRYQGPFDPNTVIASVVDKTSRTLGLSVAAPPSIRAQPVLGDAIALRDTLESLLEKISMNTGSGVEVKLSIFEEIDFTFIQVICQAPIFEPGDNQSFATLWPDLLTLAASAESQLSVVTDPQRTEFVLKLARLQ